MKRYPLSHKVDTSHPGYSSGLGPIGASLRWLETLLNSPAVRWEPGQHFAALRALRDARAVMGTDALTLAGIRPLRPDAKLDAMERNGEVLP